MYLVCDLGASSADWALCHPQKPSALITSHTELEDHSGGFGDLFERHVMPWVNSVLVDEQKITRTCIAVAGRVAGRSVRMTNGKRWLVDAEHVANMLKDRGHDPSVWLINDFEALSLGVAALLDDEEPAQSFIPVHGELEFHSVEKRVAVCGPGTGLGLSMLVLGEDENGFPLVISSEGGHHSFAPETREQLDFFESYRRTTLKVSYEDALSKEGLISIYNHFRNEQGIQRAFDADAYDILGIINSASLNNDIQAIKALDLFCEILANFCGNIALVFNLDRALFLWGGVLKEMPIDLLRYHFRKQYGNRAMHGDKVMDVPVMLLTNPQIPLRGCALKCAHGMNDDPSKHS